MTTIMNWRLGSAAIILFFATKHVFIHLAKLIGSPEHYGNPLIVLLIVLFFAAVYAKRLVKIGNRPIKTKTKAIPKKCKLCSIDVSKVSRIANINNADVLLCQWCNNRLNTGESFESIRDSHARKRSKR